jgi:hypothetical protein
LSNKLPHPALSGNVVMHTKCRRSNLQFGAL